MTKQFDEQPGSWTLSSSELARMIDVSAVQSFHTESDIRQLAASALESRFIAAHALPHFVPLLRSLIPHGAPTLVGAPIGFPSGGHMTTIKVAEARALVDAGADELDMVINLGRLKSGSRRYVVNEIKAVVGAIAPLPLKVILEVSRLTNDEIQQGSECVVEGGAAFVKTGSGWMSEPTTIEHVRLISMVVCGSLQIKASGGIRDLKTVHSMILLGVTRFGINASVALDLLKECATLSDARVHANLPG